MKELKEIFSSPTEDSDPDDEPEEDSSSSSEDEDVSMRSLMNDYNQGNLEDDDNDSSYAESEENSDIVDGSDLSGSSVATGANSEVSACSLSEPEEEGNEDDNEQVIDPSEQNRYKLIFTELFDHQLIDTLNSTTTQLIIEDNDKIHELKLVYFPDKGYWQNGTFEFSLSFPLEFNDLPPEVKCLTKIFHPNISEVGEVQCDILKLAEDSQEGTGWKAGEGTINDVVFGVISLFHDDLKLEDAVNSEAAKLYGNDKVQFEQRVKDYIQKYAASPMAVN